MDKQIDTIDKENQIFSDISNIESLPRFNDAHSTILQPNNTNPGDLPRHNFRPTTQFIVIQKEPGLIDFIPIIFLFIIYGLIIQTVCIFIKKVNKKIYDRIVIGVLFLAPLFISLILRLYIFIFVWSLFAILMGSLYIKINRKPLQKDIPRKFYNIFKVLFIFTNIGICIFQALTILSFFFFDYALVSFFSLFLIFVYFALLCREFVYLFSETMATNTGFYSKEGVPNRNNNDSLCMICTKIFDNTELVHTLICNHSFHENCIKGWCMIAKKQSCPYCKKGVDLESIPKDLWYKSEIWFYPLINTLRNFIVFAVSLLVVISYRIKTS